MKTRLGLLLHVLTLVLALSMGVSAMSAYAVTGNPGVYTLDADFDKGTLVNVNHNAPNNDQLQLDSVATPFKFIWVAASSRGTIIKIDTVTGAILGEYRSAPDGRDRNPSRTTVDGNGNVWSANRDEATEDAGSIIKIGLLENGQCVDRNGNGTIDTSTGLGDIKLWPNTGGVDNDGGVETAEDECILIYQRLPDAPNARHVSVDANNDVWVAGYPFNPTTFHQLDGASGAIVDSFSAATIGCGGYGGLIDGSGILWSAALSQNSLLRYDPITATGTCISVALSYGMGIDSNGFIWNSMWTSNTIVKVSPAGVIQGTFPTSGTCSRGVVVTSDNDVWVANSCSNNVTRLDNNGNFKALIPVGSQPTGVAVDADGKVWVTNYFSDNAMRIDPATDTVDLTVNLGAGAGPYNYSDMTGSTLIAPPNKGAWTIVHNSGITDAVWGFVSWTADTPGDSLIQVFAASSTDGITFSPEEAVTNNADLNVPDGQHLRVRVEFTRASTGESPILYDLTILANQEPDCSNVYSSQGIVWPPNHQFIPINILGVTDPDGDAVTITIDDIFQDEPVDTHGDGRFTPDGMGVGTPTAQVRAERSGSPKVPGNGRVYHIFFTATDTFGYGCSGEVLVSVPHDKAKPPVDEGPLYDSTATTP